MKKLKSKKVILAIPLVLLLVAGAGYKMVLAPQAAPVVKKIDGDLVTLPDPFTVNLADGHYGRVTVALLLSRPPAAAAAGTESSAGPVIPQEDAVRAIVTDTLTGIDPERLINRTERHELLAQLLKDLKKSTDEPVTQVMFTDLAVQ